MEKNNKTSIKMYKDSVQQKKQQKVLQKVDKNYIKLLIKRFVFTKPVESLY